MTAYLAGLFASLDMAATGAEVIKIERSRVDGLCRWSPSFAGPEGVSHERKADTDVSLLFCSWDG